MSYQPDKMIIGRNKLPHWKGGIKPLAAELYAERIYEEQRDRPWFVDDVPAILPENVQDGRRVEVLDLIGDNGLVLPRTPYSKQDKPKIGDE